MDRLHGPDVQPCNELFVALSDLFKTKHFDIIEGDKLEDPSVAAMVGYDPNDDTKLVSITNSMIDHEPRYDLKIIDIAARSYTAVMTIKVSEIIDWHDPDHTLSSDEIEEVIAVLASTDFIDRESDHDFGHID